MVRIIQKIREKKQEKRKQKGRMTEKYRGSRKQKNY